MPTSIILIIEDYIDLYTIEDTELEQEILQHNNQIENIPRESKDYIMKQEIYKSHYWFRYQYNQIEPLDECWFFSEEPTTIYNQQLDVIIWLEDWKEGRWTSN